MALQKHGSPEPLDLRPRAHPVQPPGKTLAPVAGIITKRRIKLHDILLLSRFPLIK